VAANSSNMNVVETYLSELRDTRLYGGTEETSGYTPLANLLNEIGKGLKPKVRCVINPKNAGAGIPDGGLFTPDQKNTDMIGGQVPSRGVVEVKGFGEDVLKTIESDQVEKYVRRYGQVLVTNYWDFVLVGRGPGGKPVKLESFRIAESEADFIAKLAHPEKTANEDGPLFEELLKRGLLREAEINEPKDLAWILASYARTARVRVEKADLPALEAVRTALEEALGLEFTGEKGEHFFRSTLVQTIFYGIFSAWVLWSKENRADPKARFQWRTAVWSLHVPMINALYAQIAQPQRLGDLGVVEVLDSTEAALNRVDRSAFFEKFEEEHAVQYFYEPFLEAFDSELRKELGVWYTPPEIVQYMVARVDTVLREELHIDGGLANESVYVLDPACGTGAYLVEVLKKIEATLRGKGDSALVGADVKKAAMERVFGFEILPAPFVVSHLQLGLLLKNTGAPLKDDTERAGVYLTNSLTGWEPPTEEAKKKLAQLELAQPELKQEYDAAQRVKQDVPVLVVIGNPPYNAFAGVATSPEEKRLVETFKEGLISEWGIKKFNLDDLYVRFFRMAERRIAEMTGRGVVCYVSNYSWLDDPSFVVLRRHLLQAFSRFWVENMHGDRRISEYAPDGRTSETVFAISGHSPGIQQGVAISLWLKTGEPGESQVLFRDDLNAAKADERRAQLLSSLSDLDRDALYQRAHPTQANRFSFRPCVVGAGYLAWPRMTEVCAIPPRNGLMEKRGGALIDIDRERLEMRMRAYLDPKMDWRAFLEMGYGLTEEQAGFDPRSARAKVLDSEPFSAQRIVRYAVRPFDSRWCYYTAVNPVWNRPRPSLWGQCWPGNQFFLTRFKGAKTPEGPVIYLTPLLCDDHFLAPDAVAVPFRLKGGSLLDKDDRILLGKLGIAPDETVAVANVSVPARQYLAGLGIESPDADSETAGLIWMHALAIGYSPKYLTENADGIRQDWPRIPLPDSKDALLTSAELGRQIAALLDTENPVPGVTSGEIRPELKDIAVDSREGGGTLDPDKDLAVTAGWGHAGKDGVTMPGKGKAVERPVAGAGGSAHPSPQPSPSRGEGVVAGRLPALQAEAGETPALPGETTFDIYLNDVAYWKNVPKRVWEYTIGGYQVMKKWLSYREEALLGRPLKREEVQEVTEMARRIAAIILLEPELDANYERVKSATYAWPGVGSDE